jgi:hypothetical protein
MWRMLKQRERTEQTDWDKGTLPRLGVGGTKAIEGLESRAPTEDGAMEGSTCILKVMG